MVGNNNYIEDLYIRINFLKRERQIEGTILETSIKELIKGVKPGSLLKQSLHEISVDTKVQVDLITIGLNIGANLIIDKIVGKHQKIKNILWEKLIGNLSLST